MATSDDDSELQLAIALSLQESSTAASPTGSSEERDLRLAMALSLEGTQGAITYDKAESESQYAIDATSNSQNTAQRQTEVSRTMSSGSSVKNSFPLDRKAMEQERLARLAKRKRSASPDLPSKQTTKRATSTTPDAVQHPQGVVKRTWAYKHPRTNDITLEEVLQASTLNIAVLSSFQWEDEFFFHKADPRKIKQIWIMGAKEEALRTRILKDIAELGIPNLKPHFPPLRSGIMHSKLMLLFHPTHLRIVVPTANLMKVEWGETGQVPQTVGTWQPAVLENSLFLIDLPRLPDGGQAEKLYTAFGQELTTFLEAQEVENNVIQGLRKFDFSKTSRFGFVHSIEGSHSAEPKRSHTGLPGLARVIKQLDLHDVEHLELDYASSSLGALKKEFLHRLYLAAGGQHTLFGKGPKDFLDRIRVYFPTEDTVVNSTGGVDCGGIITLSSKSFKAPSFASQCLRNHVSTRPGVLSHNKMLLARGCKKDGRPFAWAYVGSANATESAWGAQSILKSGKESVLKINNWECGVVLAVPGEKMQGLADGEVPPMSVFEGTVEVPFQFPGERYEGRQPWLFHEHESKIG